MKRVVLYTLIAILATACEKTVKVDIPTKPPKLVVNGLLEKGETILMHIGKSRGVLEPDNYTTSLIEQYTVKNAVVVLFENGVSIDTLAYRASDYTYYSPRSRVARDGATYKIKATAPGFTMTAEAESQVPSQSVIAGVTWNRRVRNDSEGYPLDDITIRLNDPASEKNFYLVQVHGASPYTQYGYFCVSSTDKDLEPTAETDPLDPDNCYNAYRMLMKDQNFNGGLKQLKLSVSSSILDSQFNPSTGNMNNGYVKVYRITEDQFRFFKSMDAYDSGSENPFAEPTNVFTNVKNGYGIFSISTVAVDTLR